MRGGAAALFATALAAGCDRPFEPFAPNENGPFSLLGYLDLKADTQWVRVTPIRQTLLGGPEAIDAVVTLQHTATGRTVTMRDSLFTYEDPRLEGIAYAHVFWTTERLEPKARYRVTATASDGAASTAVVDMPADLEISLLNAEGARDTAWLEVRAEQVLLVETLHTMTSPNGTARQSVAKRQRAPIRVDQSTLYAVAIDGTPPFQEGLVDVGRTELRVAAAGAAWPALVRLPGGAVAEQPDVPSNVENGLGYVGAAATWTIPFHRCGVLVRRPDDSQTCAIRYSARSASLSGIVVRQPCARPHSLADVRLTERFTDGGAVVRRWKTGWDGGYRFEGIEPGADLTLQVGTNAPIPLPRLAPGQRFLVPEQNVTVTTGC